MAAIIKELKQLYNGAIYSKGLIAPIYIDTLTNEDLKKL